MWHMRWPPIATPCKAEGTSFKTTCLHFWNSILFLPRQEQTPRSLPPCFSFRALRRKLTGQRLRSKLALAAALAVPARRRRDEGGIEILDAPKRNMWAVLGFNKDMFIAFSLRHMRPAPSRTCVASSHWPGRKPLVLCALGLNRLWTGHENCSGS